MGLHDEVIPVLARNCVNRVKVLRGVEIHGDQRVALEHALVKLLTLWLVEGEEIRTAALRKGLRHGPGILLRDRVRLVVRERMGLTGPLEEIPTIDDEDIREVLAEVLGELPIPDPEPPFLVQLCVDLLRSSDFAEIEATDEELVRELHAALADAPRGLEDPLERHLRRPGPRLRLPLQSDVPLESGVRRFLEWLRGGGGPPSDGPGGSCPPPAVPV